MSARQDLVDALERAGLRVHADPTYARCSVGRLGFVELIHHQRWRSWVYSEDFGRHDTADAAVAALVAGLRRLKASVDGALP